MALPRPKASKPTSKCPACDTSPFGAPLPDPTRPAQLCQSCMNKHANIPSSDARNNPVSLARVGRSEPFPAASQPRSTLKRQVLSSPFELLPEGYAGRMFANDELEGGNNYTANSGDYESSEGPLVRSSIGGVAGFRNVMRDESVSVDEREDEFVDAAENLPSSTFVAGSAYADGGDCEDGDEVPEKVRKSGYIEIPRHEQQHMEGVVRFGEEETVAENDGEKTKEDGGNQDLFSTAFGGDERVMEISSDDDSASTSSDSNSSDCDSENNKSNPPSFPSDRNPNPSSQTNTTTTTSSPTSLPIDPLEHLSPHLHTLTKFHSRALHFLPRLPLAPHRYWIGVLNHNETGRNLHSEKQFTWLRGNRLTTIRTVWRKYAEVNVVEGFALYIGGASVPGPGGEGVRLGAGVVERPGMGVRMEEVDFCGDRRVILRAVCGKRGKGRDLERCAQRGVFEGLVGERKEGGKEVEVVVLDD